MIVDHVTVAGRSLEAMQARFAGLRFEYGGAHQNRATEMALASFPDGSYLELIALQPEADPAAVEAHIWGKYIQGEAGPCAWAVRADDLEAAGVSVCETVPGARLRPDGVRLEWRTARLGPEPDGTFLPFLIQDVTPREARACPHGVDPRFTGITKIVLGVRDVRTAAQRFQGVSLCGTLVEFAEPRGWVAERIERFGEGPVAFELGRPDGPALLIR